MTKKLLNSSAAIPATGTKPQDGAPAADLTGAPTPSGENGPDGTNTTASSGDAAVSAPAGTVKPHGEDGKSTPATGTEATISQPASGAEASAPGDIVSNAGPSQGNANGEAGDTAGPAGGISQALADAFLSQLGLEPAERPERRKVYVTTAYRRGGKYQEGGPQPLTKQVFDELEAAGIVRTRWEDCKLVED